MSNRPDTTAGSTKVKPIPDGMYTATPHLVCRDAFAAIEFYKKAFNATGESVMKGPDGKMMHGQIMIGNSPIMLVEEFPDWGVLSPQALNGSPVTIHLYVEDVDSVYAQAVRAGATALMPPDDAFWGDRYGKLTDPFGHSWSIATHVKDMTPEEMAAGMQEAFSSDEHCGKKD